MTNRDTILKELQELNSSLADLALQNTYQAPAGYFDGLANEILKRVKALDAVTPTEELASLSSLLNGIKKEMPYSVPAGYFDTVEKKVKQTISDQTELSAEEELQTLSPLLSGLKNKETYRVPAGYFENLTTPVGVDIKRSEAKVVSFTGRKWFRYAAAAVLIGFIATFTFISQSKKDIDPGTKSYAWIQKNLKKVSTDDINKFVELASTETADIVKVDAKDDISNLVKDISDKEIQDFLNDTPSDEAEDDIILN